MSHAWKKDPDQRLHVQIPKGGGGHAEEVVPRMDNEGQRTLCADQSSPEANFSFKAPNL
jgi:hypothetical protein